MKSILIALAIANIIAAPCLAETYVSGSISSDETWTPSGSPYIIIDSVFVSQNISLTISAGVTVRFQPGNVTLVTDSGASLYINGTADNPVQFCSNVADPTPGSYYGLSLNSGSVVTMSYCLIQHASYGLSTAAFIAASNTTIRNCGIGVDIIGVGGVSGMTIKDNVHSGVFIDQFSYGTIRDCTIENNGVSGVESHYEPGSGGIVENCTIRNNAGDGIFMAGTVSNCVINGNDGNGATLISNSTIEWSTVSNNLGYGIYFILRPPDLTSTPMAHWNNLFDNGGYEIVADWSCYAPEVDARNNYWGTTNAADIEAWILDHNDDPSLTSIILYSPFEAQVGTSQWTWGAVKNAFR